MTRFGCTLAAFLVAVSAGRAESWREDWTVDIGLRGFKYSASGIPNEIAFNPVFARWEAINQQSDEFAVSAYNALDPLYFNVSLGVDVFLRYRRHLLVRIGYDYSNPMGIGGKGDIEYRELATGKLIRERKEFSYTSHQLNYFVGPILPIGSNGSEAYIAFSLMPPTWVTYREEYRREEDGTTVRRYDETFDGFFGSCRALIGVQVPVTERIKLGSEAIFSFLNFMELSSGDLEDRSFQFPMMKWEFTVRYGL